MLCMERDLDKALADILTIRTQIAAGTSFQGYGPAAVATTGALAAGTAVAQFLWLPDPTASPVTFLAGWIATAVLSLVIVGLEMRARARRHHTGLADEMIYAAIENFLPAGAAGAFLALVVVRFAPEATWMVPGLWQVLVGLGTFASARSLPRGVPLVAGWYLVSGLAVLMLASEDQRLSPWLMGIPFIVGQLAMAALLHTASGGHDGDA
jgi:hypothetical protein